MRVLVVEDDQQLISLLGAALTKAGHVMVATSSARVGLARASEEEFDVVVLDRSLPDGDGLDVCRRLRHSGTQVPVLLLTARGSVDDRVEGLDAGANDYLSKPFAMEELLARLRALTRTRSRAKERGVLIVSDLRLDVHRHEASRDGVTLDLTPREFALLALFMRHPGHVIRRDEALAQVWDLDFAGGSNIVDVYVRRLREKIDRPFGTNMFQTVRGVGYRLVATRE